MSLLTSRALDQYELVNTLESLRRDFGRETFFSAFQYQSL
jgi:hypothetical protein